MEWLLLGASFFGLVVVLVLDGLRRERAVERDWRLVLTPRAQQELDVARRRADAELELLDASVEGARAAYASGSTESAHLLLDQGCSLIEAYCPSMLRMLAAMSVLSRMVAAMGSVQPLRPADFRLRGVAQLALLGRFLHHLAATSQERFRLRVFILGRGFVLLTRAALRSFHLARFAPRAPWDDLDDVRHDARALTNESMESLRGLLMALAAERR